MKNFLIFTCSILFIVSCQKSNKTDELFDDAAPVYLEQSVVSIENSYDTTAVNMFVREFHKGDSINVPFEDTIQINEDSRVVFVDPSPTANWGHECYYYVIPVSGGNTRTVKMNFPPEDLSSWTVISNHTPQPSSSPLLYDFSLLTKTHNMDSGDNNKWAVILSGGIDTTMNHIRYRNDCVAIYNVLRNKYHFPANHIYVIMADGASYDFDGDGVNDVNYSANNTNISSVFTTLGQNVQDGDEILVFVTDHGGRENNVSYICLWGNQKLYPSAFNTQINKITTQANKHIVLGQCYSGGFVNAISGPQVTVATACSATEASYATSDLQYDEFLYHWTAAIMGQYPSGTLVTGADSNNDGKISLIEAFSYAQTHDTQPETPQFYQGTSLYGNIPFAYQYRFINPVVAGPDEIGEGDYFIYTLAYKNPDESVVWNCCNDIQIVSSTDTTATVIVPTGAEMNIGAYVRAFVSAPYCNVIPEKDSIVVWKNGIVPISEPYIHAEFGFARGTAFFIWPLCHAYNYTWSVSGNWEVEEQGSYNVDFYNEHFDPTESEIEVEAEVANPFGGTTIFRITHEVML